MVGFESGVIQDQCFFDKRDFLSYNLSAVAVFTLKELFMKKYVVIGLLCLSSSSYVWSGMYDDDVEYVRTSTGEYVPYVPITKCNLSEQERQAGQQRLEMVKASYDKMTPQEKAVLIQYIHKDSK